MRTYIPYLVFIVSLMWACGGGEYSGAISMASLFGMALCLARFCQSVERPPKWTN